MSTPDSSASLFDRLGGAPAIDAAVDKFYEKVLADERIKHFFEGVNMDIQAAHQKSFLTYAFGGPNAYAGKPMREGHKRLVDDMGLTDSHFDAVMENHGATLKELGVPDEPYRGSCRSRGVGSWRRSGSIKPGPAS